ncbi:uncharacterized protein V1516DRAFT_679423 [Lipomyces oligophaga]|uniref:uncharacterized protein n=1 Tax=Lipomyces oligophaga TaxID=45792 RepID=UPI0034CF190B
MALYNDLQTRNFYSFTESLRSIRAQEPDIYSDRSPLKTRELNQWLFCFCALNFNVEVGPEFECMYPILDFSEQDLKTICFSSFPEQSYSETVESFHSFRFKVTSPKIQFPSSAQARLLTRTPFPADREMHGYVFFQQRKDRSKSRNYSQRSLTLLSAFEFPAVFEQCIRRLADIALRTSSTTALLATLQTAAVQISRWPAPEMIISRMSTGIPANDSSPTKSPKSSKLLKSPRSPAKSPKSQRRRKAIELAYLGEKIKICLLSSDPTMPLTDFTSELPSGNSNSAMLFGKVGSWVQLLYELIDPIDIFTIYEQIILGGSITVLASTPADASQFVTNAVDLIKPIPYSGLIREYATLEGISAGDTSLNKAIPGITGTTNPFLAQHVEKGIESNKLDTILVDLTASKHSPFSSKSSSDSSTDLPTMKVKFLPVIPDMMLPNMAATQQATVDLLYPVTATVDWQRKSFKKLLTSAGIMRPASSVHASSPKFLVRDLEFVKQVKLMMSEIARIQSVASVASQAGNIEGEPSEQETSAAIAALNRKLDKYLRLYFTGLTGKILAPIRRYMFVAEITPKNFSFSGFMNRLGKLEKQLVLGNGGLTGHEGRVLNGVGHTLRSVTGFVRGQRLNNRCPESTGFDFSGESADPSDSEGLTSSTPNTDNRDDLYLEAVRPAPHIFLDYARAMQFYSRLLVTSNFESWCFL